MIKLISGTGSPEVGACWMAALNWYVGNGSKEFKWSDHPECVDPLIQKLCILLNDNLPDVERAAFIAPYLFLPVGTNYGHALTVRRTFRMLDVLIRKWLPDIINDGQLVQHLRTIRPIVDIETAEVSIPVLYDIKRVCMLNHTYNLHTIVNTLAFAMGRDFTGHFDLDWATYWTLDRVFNLVLGQVPNNNQHHLNLIIELCYMGRKIPICQHTEISTIEVLSGIRSW